MKKYFKILLILFVGTIIFSFYQSTRHRIQVIFKREKSLFEMITTDGKPNLELCHVYRGKILGLQQAVAYTSLDGIDLDIQKAFYINAYNLAVIAQLNEHYPFVSIEEIEGFFSFGEFLVAQKKYNIQSLRRYIVEKFNDPRVHFTLYLGGISSPKIPKSAFYHQQVEKQLVDITTAFVNDLSCVKIKTRSKMVLLPEFMLWSKKDFDIDDRQEFLKYINRFRSEAKQIPDNYVIDFYPYSWKIE
jgi:hypothetical protein